MTELLIGLAFAVVGYLLRHYGVKIPGVPGGSTPSTPATPQTGPILSAVLALLRARLGGGIVPLVGVDMPTIPPVPAVPTPPGTAPPVRGDSDAEIALARELLIRHFPAEK